MKKILTALACASLMAITANADIARLEMGVGFMQQNTSGKVTYTKSGANGSYSSDEKDSTQPYVWAIIKHPIPIIPNLRLEYITFEDSGKATGKFENFDILSDVSKTTFDITEYDIIPYYNLLDNTFWATIDVGLDIKIMEIDYEAKSVGVFAGDKDSISVILPLGYIRGRVEIPGTVVGLEADLKYVEYGSSSVYDARIKVDYTFDMFPIVQPAIEIGYRAHKVDIDDSAFGDLKADLEFSGFYAGAMLRF
ncbi:TIGR04219 family outer membrane beta-barrel protein [Sulfurimonas sp.]|uniref:TIGR04219 family outer membrane beta-barrel protein n=1 Tax=Sulfurimonas sp. TaxID=2022749 RepID=UPI0025D829FC|nr:TIGR04219 family outer membrane beta-barrel protein [Sulfurimonas sp.]